MAVCDFSDSIEVVRPREQSPDGSSVSGMSDFALFATVVFVFSFSQTFVDGLAEGRLVGGRIMGVEKKVV